MHLTKKCDIKWKKYAVTVFFLGVVLCSFFSACTLAKLNGLDSFEKEITSFVFKASRNSGLTSDITGRIESDTVHIIVPFGTSLNLIPTIGINGKSISPPSNISQSFTDNVGLPYTVTAEDGSTRTFMVIVHVAPHEGIPPGCVMLTNVIEDNTQVSFQWTDPPDEDLDHIEITWTPDGAAINFVSAGGAAFTATGLTNGTEYTFSLVSVDLAGNRSAPVTATAVPQSGSGPVINYCIYTAADLNAVRGGIKTGWDKTKSYIMMADVDLAGFSPWVPIGTDGDVFSGNLNGNGHRITGLYINDDGDYQGLFGYISGPTVIKDLTILDCNITGGLYLGALAGKFDQDGTGTATISNVHVSGTITSVVGGVIYAGGLVGWLGPKVYSALTSLVTGCGVSITLTTGSNQSIYGFLGGITGRQEGQWRISECYVEGTISSPKGAYLGGLVGSTNGWISDCYSRADVAGWEYVGGLCGGSTTDIYNSYATGDVTRTTGTYTGFGGLLGSGSGAGRYVTCCYSGTLIGGITDNAFGDRKTGTEMKVQATYSGWNFTTIWNIDGATNSGFPYLRSNPP